MRSNKFISGICIVGFTALVVIMATRRNEERASVNPVEAEAERAETVDHSPPPPPGPTPAYAGVIAKNKGLTITHSRFTTQTSQPSFSRKSACACFA